MTLHRTLVVFLLAIGVAHWVHTLPHRPHRPAPLRATPSAEAQRAALTLRLMTNAIDLGDLDTPGQFAANHKENR